VGTTNMLADAEVVTIAYQCLRQLGFTAFRILINNRKILQSVIEKAEIPPQKAPAVWRAVDKWDKIGPEGVRAELATSGLTKDTLDRLFDLLDVSGDATAVLQTLGGRLAGSPVAAEGIHELAEIGKYLNLADVPSRFYQIDPHMVRGLEYYTGPIFEIVVDEPRIGSLSGGGRYDHLIGLLGSPEYPAVGISLGLERLIDVIDELGMAPSDVRSTVTEVLVTVFDPEHLAVSLATAASLRARGVKCEVFLGGEKLASQLRYASRKNIPLVVIVGPDELRRGEAVLRNMVNGEQQAVGRDALVSVIQAGMSAIGPPNHSA